MIFRVIILNRYFKKKHIILNIKAYILTLSVLMRLIKRGSKW
jgi:hypothetical protein